MKNKRRMRGMEGTDLRTEEEEEVYSYLRKNRNRKNR
jgi:hypothetical protein